MDGYEARRQRESAQDRLWADIMADNHVDCAHNCKSEHDHEAYALFQTVSRAFTSRTGFNPWKTRTHHELFQYLADWAMNKVGRGAGGEVVTEGRDHHLGRTWDALFWTLQEAVKRRNVVRQGDEVFYGFFLLPAWFVEQFGQMGYDEDWDLAHQINRGWNRDEIGDFRDFVREECRPTVS